WPKATVLLTFLVAGSLRRPIVQSNPAHFPRLNVPRFVAISEATVRLAFQKHCLVDYDVTESLPRPLARSMLGGTALMALLNALPPASGQDQPATNPPPAQTQAPQESTPPSPSPSAPPASTPAPTPSPQISGGGTQLPQISVRAARRPAPRAVVRR